MVDSLSPRGHCLPCRKPDEVPTRPKGSLRGCWRRNLPVVQLGESPWRRGVQRGEGRRPPRARLP